MGVSDATVDPEFEESKKRFERTIRELNELGAVRESRHAFLISLYCWDKLFVYRK
jgi:hypothetical protein